MLGMRYFRSTRRPGEPDKLQAKAVGPYKVVGKPSDTSVLIQTSESEVNKLPKTDKISVRRVIKYPTPNQIRANNRKGKPKPHTAVQLPKTTLSSHNNTNTNSNKTKVTDPSPTLRRSVRLKSKRDDLNEKYKLNVNESFLSCSNSYPRSSSSSSNLIVGFCCTTCLRGPTVAECV